MIITRNKLLDNQRAIDKYKDRIVKTFWASKSIWFGESYNVSSKKDAYACKLSEALQMTSLYSSDSRIEFHFQDQFGDSALGINDFDDESVYNCPNVSWDPDYRKTHR